MVNHWSSKYKSHSSDLKKYIKSHMGIVTHLYFHAHKARNETEDSQSNL